MTPQGRTFFTQLAVASRDYVVAPLAGAIQQHVSGKELLDVVTTSLAAGGLTAVLPALAGHPEQWTVGLTTDQLAAVSTLLVACLRFAQRYFQGVAPPPSACRQDRSV